MRSANANQAEVGCRLPELISWDKVGPFDEFFAALDFLTAPSSPVDQESFTWPAFIAELIEGLVKFAAKKPSVLHPFLPTIVKVLDTCLEEDFYFERSGTQMPTLHSFVLLNFEQIIMVSSLRFLVPFCTKFEAKFFSAFPEFSIVAMLIKNIFFSFSSFLYSFSHPSLSSAGRIQRWSSHESHFPQNSQGMRSVSARI